MLELSLCYLSAAFLRWCRFFLLKTHDVRTIVKLVLDLLRQAFFIARSICEHASSLAITNVRIRSIIKTHHSILKVALVFRYTPFSILISRWRCQALVKLIKCVSYFEMMLEYTRIRLLTTTG